MKNIFRILMAVAVLFTASCAKEDISSSIGGGEVEVTFTANLPELGTRAYGDGTQVNKLRYYVFDQNGTLLEGLSNSITEDPGTKFFSVTLVLIKGMTYNILFWADSNSGHYSVGDNGIISVVNTPEHKINANDESRDAFYAAVKGFNPADANADTTIELYRPFAQLNAKVTNMDEVNKSIKVESTTISTKIYTTFNPLFAANATDVVGGLTEQPVTFTATEMTAEDIAAGYLSMNYLLAPAGGCVANVTFTFNNDKEVAITGTTYTSVPLKANYRTNIIGKLLTNSTDFTVEVKPGFGQDEPESTYVATIEDLQTAINNAPEGETKIVLGANMNGNVTVIQKEGVKIIIDGNNREFDGSIKVHSNSNHYPTAALTIQNVNFKSATKSLNFIEALENGAARYSTNITVQDCTFTAVDTRSAISTAVGVQIKASKNAKVLNCTATGLHSLIQAQSCDETVVVKGCNINGKNGVAFKQVKDATVEECEISATGYGIRFDGNTDDYGIVVKNNNVTAAKPLIVRRMTGKNNTIALEGTNTLTTEAEYQVVVTNGEDDAAYVKPTGTYTLTGADGYTCFPAPFPVASWDEFTAALAAGEDWIKLTQNITYEGSSSYDLKKDVVVEMNGKTFTTGNASTTWLNIMGSKATFKGGIIEGKVYVQKNGGVYSNATFENVTFGGTITFSSVTQGSLAVQGGNSVYAKKCTFKGKGSTTPNVVSLEGTSSGSVIFEDCTFNSSMNRFYANTIGGTAVFKLLNCSFNKAAVIEIDKTWDLNNMTITGCTPSAFVESVKLYIAKSKDSLTDEEKVILDEFKANNKKSKVLCNSVEY